MSETDTHEMESVAAAKIAELRVTLRSDKFNGPEWDAHRELQASAARLSNGEKGSMAAQSDALCRIATVITQDRIREPARLAEALKLIHSCPVQPLMTRDANSRDVMPWTPAIKNAIEDVRVEIATLKAPEDNSSFSFMGITVRGKTMVKYSVTILAVVFTIWMLLSRQDAAFKDMQQNFLPEIKKALNAQTISIEDQITENEAGTPAVKTGEKQ